MTSTAEQYQTALRPLTAVVDAVPQDGWEAPSPCEGWTARDVLRHVVETQRELLEPHGADLGALPDLDTDPPNGWRAHTDRVLAALTEQDLAERTYQGHFGPTTVGDTLERYYVWDMYVHRWDLARAAGLDAGLTEAELDLVEQGTEGFGEALYYEGICRPALDVPPDADRTTRVLARLGRRA